MIIDKIALTIDTSKVEIIDNEKLIIQVTTNWNSDNIGEILFSNCRVKADKVYYNSEDFILETRKFFTEKEGVKNTMIIRFNPSGVNIEENILHSKQIIDSIKKIIGFDNNDLSVNRIDLANDMNMTHTCNYYIDILTEIKSHGRRKNVSYQGETFYLRNKSREIVFYDKGLQLEKKQSRLLRFETRLRKKIAVRKNLDIFSLSELYEKKENLVEYYNTEKLDIIEKFNLIKNKKSIEFLNSEQKQKIIEFYNQYNKDGRYWIADFLKTLGITVLKSAFTPDEFRQLIYNTVSETHFQRLKKLFDDSDRLNWNTEQVNLIDELKAKL